MQIGPRIRIGGTLGHIGQQAKLAIGKVAENPLVDAAISFIPGVGPIAAGAIGAAGRALDTSGGSVGLGDIAKAGAEGYGAAELGHGLVGGVGKLFGGGAGAATPVGEVVPVGGASGATGAAGDGGIMQTARNVFGDAKDIGGKIIGAGEKVLGIGGDGTPNASGSSTLDKLLEAAGLYSSLEGQKHVSDLQNDALKAVTDQYNANAPLRDAGRAALLNPTRPDLSGLTANSPNPYQSKYRIGSAVPVAPAGGA